MTKVLVRYYSSYGLYVVKSISDRLVEQFKRVSGSSGSNVRLRLPADADDVFVR